MKIQPPGQPLRRQQRTITVGGVEYDFTMRGEVLVAGKPIVERDLPAGFFAQLDADDERYVFDFFTLKETVTVTIDLYVDAASDIWIECGKQWALDYCVGLCESGYVVHDSWSVAEIPGEEEQWLRVSFTVLETTPILQLTARCWPYGWRQMTVNPAAPMIIQ